MRRPVALELLLCIAWSSIEVLCAEESLTAVEAMASVVSSSASEESGVDDSACLCACGCQAVCVIVAAEHDPGILLILLPIEWAEQPADAPHSHYDTPPVPPPIHFS